MKAPTTFMRSSSENVSPASPPTVSPASQSPLVYALTIFLSAFLLFQIQPVIAKIILPWFGGSAAVWTACMLFFQLALLLGYLYAHWIATRLPSRNQSIVHIALLTLSLVSLPVLPGAWWKPSGSGEPLLRILGLLAATIGLPYLLLSATSPLLQSWHARSSGGTVPYRFFALSNAASMLALLSYPVAVEPYFTTHAQAWTWSVTYAAFTVFCAFAAWRSWHAPAPKRAPAIHARARPPGSLQLLWLALAACASALLLSVTNHLSQNVAAIPFLWVLPHSIYLLTFILCFENPRWYRRAAFVRLAAVALCSMAYATSNSIEISDLRISLPLFAFSLFICCMVCHGELARLKPDAQHLTTFYLMTAAGGALGGLFVAFLAPAVFPALYEFPIAITTCGFLIVYVFYRQNPRGSLHSPVWFICAALALAIGVYVAHETRATVAGSRLLVRNFYGTLRVNDDEKTADEEATRQLTHGTINHGQQFLSPDLRRKPTTYYGPTTGIGVALKQLGRSGPLRVGVIGLGTGTLAAYGRAGDTFRFYEINPLVPRIANTQFTFLQDSAARIDVVLGDARLSQEREPAQHFDLLAVDAFSGDSVPVHLLTREACAVYWRHLKPDGVLAFHVSNKFLDLAPVAKQTAAASQRDALLVSNEIDDETGTFEADWVLVTNREDLSRWPFAAGPPKKISVGPRMRMWTDDYSNLWQSLK